jgi:hypothetical protein
MSVGDIYRVTIRGLLGADDNENVFHYQVSASTGPTSDEAASLANEWVNSAKASYLALLSVLYNMQEVKVRGVSDPTQGFDLSSTGNGGQAGEVSPAQNASLAILRTAKFGRSFRGKTYFPAQAETAFSSGSVVPGQVSNIATYFGDAATLVSGSPIVATFVLGVYSKTLLQFNVFTGHTVSPFAATQRRRRPGVGS